jgi:hypothetical protein
VATVPLGPAQADITGARAGDRNAFQLTVQSKGAPFNLTGQTITAQARLTSLDVAHLDAVIDIIDATGGICVVRWPGDDVRTLLNGKATWTGVWDLQIQATGQDPITLIGGAFTAVMDVTRVGP